MPLACPACGGDLASMESQGHYGTRLIVERCVRCRGFWLNATEPVSLGYDAVLLLEGDADFARVSRHARDDFRPCPQCGLALEETRGGPLPDGLHVDTCRTCHGMWFDGGELLVYKSALEAKRRQQRQERLAAEHRQLGLRRGPGNALTQLVESLADMA